MAATGSLLCVGLDPHPHLLSERSATAAAALCLDIIEQTADSAAAFKANAAFFERFGAAGWSALADVVGAVPEDTPTIVDAKRGDIGSTAEAYADALFDGLGADAVTLSPYLGADAIEPFLRPGKSVFVLARTSNPGGADLQDLLLADGSHLYERVAATFGDVGLVVGATAPEALARVRAVAPDAWILAPGVGAQGGDLEAAVAAGKRADGSGLLVPVSRAIADAADRATEARRLRNAIAAVPPSSPIDPADAAAMALADAGCIRFGEFTLKSGQTSPVYLDLRRLVSSPRALMAVARVLAAQLSSIDYDHIAAIPYAALPIGTAVASITGSSLVYPRREVKEYGTKASVEGVFEPGDRAVLLDDLATSGDSKFEAIERLTEAGLTVADVVVLVDRQGGAAEALVEAGYRFHAAFTLTDLARRLEAHGRITADELDAVIDFVG